MKTAIDAIHRYFHENSDLQQKFSHRRWQMLRTLASAVVVLTVSVGSAMAQTLTLDNFASGFDNTVATTTQPTSCKTLTPTTPLGSSRSTTLNIAQNPFELSSQMNIGNGHLIVDAGLNVYAGLTLVYGVDCINGSFPLALNLKPYGRFRINFPGLNGGSSANLVQVTVPFEQRRR